MPTIDNVDHYSEVLASTSFFEDFEDAQLQSLVGACQRRQLASREALWAVGASGDAAYILIDGRLEQTRLLPPDDKRVDQISETGTPIGLSYLVKAWDHDSTMTAIEATELLELKRPAFNELFDDGQIAAYRLVDHLAEQLVRQMRDANERLHDVFGNPAETLRMLRRRVRKA